jgi:5,5'-dehydrodivanillate O-demethylase oxygenase subunit
LKEKVKATAYPLQEFCGLIYAYMGPSPVPLLPDWEVMRRDDGKRLIEVLPVLNCNWLQIMENSVDPCHTYYLHAHTLAMKGRADRGAYYYRPIRNLNFEIVKTPTWGGVTKQRIYGGDQAEEERGHPVIFPNMLLSPQREHLVMHIRVPIDDTHTRIFRVQFTPNEDGRPEPQPEQVPVKYQDSFRNEDGEFHLDTFSSQDAMAWETQGPITDRERETLGSSDRGIVMYRRLLREQIDAMAEGKEPIGIIRDPSLNRRIKIEVSTGQARMARMAGAAG